MDYIYTHTESDYKYIEYIRDISIY